MPTPKKKKFMSATIGRIGNGEMPKIPFTQGDTVAHLVNKAHLNLVQGEEVNDEYGNPVALTTPAKETTYYVVKNMKNAGFS